MSFSVTENIEIPRINASPKPLQVRIRDFLGSLSPKGTTADDGRYDHFIPKNQQHTEGYPQLADYISSDTSSKLFRRFTYLRTRLLLNRQTSLTNLETRLASFDIEVSRGTPALLQSVAPGHPTNSSIGRVDILCQIEKELKEYDELLLRENSIAAIKSAPKHAFLSLFNWIWEVKPISNDEKKFIYHRDDFLALGANEEYWFLGFTHKCRHLLPSFMFSQDQNESHKANAKLALLAKILLALSSAIFLLLPCTLLFLIEMPKQAQVGVCCSAVLLFSFIMTVFTMARLHEVLISVAAYTAVLVVFLGSQEVSFDLDLPV